MSLVDLWRCSQHHPDSCPGGASVTTKHPRTVYQPISGPPLARLPGCPIWSSSNTTTPPPPLHHPLRPYPGLPSAITLPDLTTCMLLSTGRLRAHQVRWRHESEQRRTLLLRRRTREPRTQPCQSCRPYTPFSCASQPPCSQRRPNTMAATRLHRNARHRPRRLQILLHFSFLFPPCCLCCLFPPTPVACLIVPRPFKTFLFNASHQI